MDIDGFISKTDGYSQNNFSNKYRVSFSRGLFFLLKDEKHGIFFAKELQSGVTLIPFFFGKLTSDFNHRINGREYYERYETYSYKFSCHGSMGAVFANCKYKHRFCCGCESTK